MSINILLYLIQTTSYNFSKPGTTKEVCVGVVKAAPVHPKNPHQHILDLSMLENKEELKPVFFNIDVQPERPKLVECIRVNGASDEGHHIQKYNTGGPYVMYKRRDW